MYLQPSKHVLYIVGSLQNCDKYFTSGSHSCVRLINKYEKGSLVASMQILIREGLIFTSLRDVKQSLTGCYVSIDKGRLNFFLNMENSILAWLAEVWGQK